MSEYAIKQPYDMEAEKEFKVSKTLNGITKTVRGEQVENGWVISITKEGNFGREREDGSREWEHETKKFISVENPLDKLKGKQKTEMQNAEELLNSILGPGMLMV
jgi:hypothetical protein